MSARHQAYESIDTKIDHLTRLIADLHSPLIRFQSVNALQKHYPLTPAYKTREWYTPLLHQSLPRHVASDESVWLYQVQWLAIIRRSFPR